MNKSILYYYLMYFPRCITYHFTLPVFLPVFLYIQPSAQSGAFHTFCRRCPYIPMSLLLSHYSSQPFPYMVVYCVCDAFRRSVFSRALPNKTQATNHSERPRGGGGRGEVLRYISDGDVRMRRNC